MPNSLSCQLTVNSVSLVNVETLALNSVVPDYLALGNALGSQGYQYLCEA